MIELNSVSKFYELAGGRKHVVLNSLSLIIDPGQIVGITGPNGVGKTTLMRIIAGTLLPNSGSVRVDGKIVPFLALGVAFHNTLTGNENVFVNGVMLGIPYRRLKELRSEIVDYAGIGEYADQPIRTYSTGMRARLAYSISRYANGSIFIYDEILGVGDESFQEKCKRNFLEQITSGHTILIVSHNKALLEGICNKVIRLGHEGSAEIRDVGGRAENLHGLFKQHAFNPVNP